MKIRSLFLKQIFFWAFLLISSSMLAQNVTVSGTVTGADSGEPLPGVSIVEKGTQNGTTTNMEGEYSISVPEDAVLTFSFVGYNTQEIPVEGRNTINVQLQQKMEELEEVVVIGYGVQKKSDKTGAVAQVTADELSGGVVTDPIQTMQGKSAGVLISKKGGDPNAGFAVQIRGASGFDSDTQPLYVVDGVPGVDPTTVAPEDIESFNILKDAASTAIYGARGSNGVVIINTKSGESGQMKIQLNVKVSADQVANKLDLLSASEMRSFAENQLLESARQQPGQSDYTVEDVFNDGGASTDWQDQIYRSGITQSYNLNISGGNENSTYYASVTQSDWTGVMKGTAKERTIAKVNLTHRAFDDRLTLSGNFSATFEQNDYENYDSYNKDDILYQAFSRNPTDPVYDEDGSYDKTNRAFNYENPLEVINKVDNNRDAKRYLGKLKADMEIFDGFTGSVNLGYIRDDQQNYIFRPKSLYASAFNGYGRQQYENNTEKLIDITGNYKKTFNEKHNIDALLGYSWQESVTEGFFAQGEDPQSPYVGSHNFRTFNDIKYGDVDSWKYMWRLIGFFGRVQYNYDSKYFFSASLRRDGSSRFGSNNRWGWFPTAAVGWDMHQEDFLSGIDWVDQLKLRASYGVSGNQEIGQYRSKVLFEPTGKAINPTTGEEVISFNPAWNANPDLKWEETTEYNFGIDFAFLDKRISGSLEFYRKNTNDLLGEYFVPVPPNLASRTFANSGKLRNQGVELFMQAYPVDMENFQWKTSINAAHNQSELLDLGEYFEEGAVRREGYITGRGLIGEETYVTGIMEGEEIGSFYLPVYAGMENGKFIFESETGGYTDQLSDAKREVAGTASPDIELGWSNTFTFYKNWELQLSFRSMIGNDVYNATRMVFDNPGNLPDLNALPEAVDWYERGRTSGPTISDLYLEDGSFVRLDYASFGYTFNTSKIDFLQSMKVYVASNNLFTITDYSGVDPETSIDGLAYGIDQYNVYPKTRTFTFGINATF
jgi:iron complex outermembrane receptor protein